MVGFTAKLKEIRERRAGRFYSTVILRYSGQGGWRVGLKPLNEPIEWINDLPFEKAIDLIEGLRTRVRRTEVKENA